MASADDRGPESSSPPLLPEALEAEQSLLGALLLAPAIAAPAVAGLSAGVFLREPHKIIYSAIMAVLDRGEPVDLVTVADELHRRGEFDRAGGGEYMQALAASVPTALNAPHYARIVSEAARRRALVMLGERLMDAARAGQLDSEGLLLETAAQLESIREHGLPPEADPPPSGLDTLPWTSEEAEAFKRSASPQVWPVTDLVLAPLWRLLGGGLPRWTLLSGQPSAGKSSLALQMMLAAVREPDSAALFLSVDMAPAVVWRRLLCLATACSWRELVASDRYSPEEGLLEATRVVGRDLAGRIAVVGSDHTPLPRLLHAARAHRRRTGASRLAVVVDYLQALPLSPEAARAATSDIARDEARVDAMRAVADSRECDALIVVSEARKPTAGRRTWAEGLADVRGSARIVYAPDAVIAMLHRPELGGDDDALQAEDLDATHERPVTLRVDKSRDGCLGDVPTLFSPSIYTFRVP